MKAHIATMGLSLTLLVHGLSFGHATTIRSVSLDEMIQGAAFVFEGTTAATIETCAWFEIRDILKGPDLVGPLELCFAGGVKDSMRRHIQRMIYPAVGEIGVYFVTSLDEKHVHPLYGWNQGYFRVRQTGTAEGGAEVHTADGEAVVDVESRTEIERGGLSTGVARGMVTRGSRAASLRAITPWVFKAKLREILEQRR
jgi:hypothetical protein